MRKHGKWAAWLVLSPFLLFLTFTILLYIPPVQTWVVKRVAAYASEKTGMEITVDRVRLVFPLDLGVEGFSMIQQNDSLPQVKDTVADVGRMVVDVKLMPLFRQRVEVDALEFNDLKMNTADFVHEARIKGRVKRLYVRSDGIDWGRETVKVNEALLTDASVMVELSDTVPPDTSKTPSRWRISVERLGITRTSVDVHMPGDTLRIGAYLGKTEARDGFFDLYKSIYKVGKFDWTEGRLAYDNRYKTHTKGLDVNHISLSDLNLGIDSLDYSAPRLGMRLRVCSFKEKSGIAVAGLSGTVSLDSASIYVPDIYLRTPDSYLKANVDMDFSAFADKQPGKMRLNAEGSFGKQDIMRFLGGMPKGFVRRWPSRSLSVKAVVVGNTRYMKLAGVNLKLPGAFNVNTKGYAANVMSPKRLRAKLTVDAQTYDLGFVEALMPKGSGVRIPRNMRLGGELRADGSKYAADLKLHEGGGAVKAKADVNTNGMAYAASVEAKDFKVGHFMPGKGFGDFSGELSAKGSGTSFLSPKTRLSAKARVTKFAYGRYSLDGINAEASLRNGLAEVSVVSENKLINGSLSLNAALNRQSIKAALAAKLNKADWYGLKLTKTPFSTSFTSNVDVYTDRRSLLSIKGRMGDFVLVDSAREFRPDDVNVSLFTRRDTIDAKVECGDFRFWLSGQRGYKYILKRLDGFKNELVRELRDKRIDMAVLRKELPQARLYLTTGKENPLSRFVANAGFTFSDANIDLSSSPVNGLNGSVLLIGLQKGKAQLDTVRFDIESDTAHCRYFGQVRNNADNPQYVFNALLDGYVFEKGSGAKLKVYDAKDSLGLNLGIEASMEEKGINLHMMADSTIIGYKKFDVNKDNYMFLGSDRRISANVKIQSADGMGVHIYSNDENTEALQDLTVGLNKFDLSKILSVLPYMPRITGIMSGDFHLIKNQDDMSVSSSIAVDSMTYERNRMGDISTEFVYIPQSGGTHTVDGTLSCNGLQIADISGSYNPVGDDNLDLNLGLSRLPMRLLNGFIPDRMIRFRGYADGNLAVKGSLGKPNANGELRLDSCYMRSGIYGISMKMSDGPVRVVGSNILFEDYKLFANNDSPLALNGHIDMSDMSAMSMDVRMVARNCQVIDSKERRRSVSFGKAFVDLFARMNGPLDNLKMRGNLNVLGTTDMSYILRDSPLSTDNQMDELVKFTDFSDTVAAVVTHEPVSGFAIDLTMNIDKGARVMCYLNPSHSNYIDLIGGGTLRMKYDASGDISLVGRYTLDNGEMKYSLPVIPLKTFTIQDGSYIEFTGDPMNPRLNITATERTKANVSSGSGQGRSVEFDCGVVITKTLSDMGLEFTLDAPEDMTLHNELQSMGVEQRGKLAVTMLTTGMYLADGNTSKFSMNSALSSFLNSEINNITGNALRTLDLSFGMDNSMDASGNTQTDYSFKFAKRFWNNRMRIVVGGKVSTGSEMPNQNESFLDNVTFEYRLGKSAEKYVKLFYDNNAYDWLEDTTREYGVGFIWRRSLQHFKDIFRFKKATPMMPAKPDTTRNKKAK